MYLMQLYSQLSLISPQTRQIIPEESEQLLPNLEQKKAAKKLTKIKTNYYLERRLFI